DHRHVPAHEVHELADADRPRITVAAHADRKQRPVGEQGPRAHRRHPPMDGVEPVRRTEEVRRALARTANARQLDDLPGIDAHLEERVDDALRYRIVTAPGTQGRLTA